MKSKIIPIVFTMIFIALFICLFASIKQPLVICDKRVEDQFGNVVFEELSTTINGNDIASIQLIKTLIISDKYIGDINDIVLRLEQSYEYLDSAVSINVDNNKIIIVINIDDDQTVILNNIKFYENNGLKIKVNPNTKSDDVITLKIGDNYTEGELMTRLKNNGYSCR